MGGAEIALLRFVAFVAGGVVVVVVALGFFVVLGLI